MAQVTRVNPVSMTTNFENLSKDLSFFTVDYINAINGSVGPEGALQAAYNTIQRYYTIVAAGPLIDTNTQQTFAVEGAIVAAEATTLQTALQALGTVDTVDLSSSTVTRTKLGILTASAVADETAF
jgi:hypothetical protein